MCTFNIALDDALVKNARSSFSNEKMMTTWMEEQVAALLRSIVLPKSTDGEIDPFAELDTSWGGDHDANEIAEELHSMRDDCRIAETTF